MTPAEMKELMLSKRSEINSKSKRTNVISLKDGTNRIRVLRGWRKDDPATFWHPFGQHFIKGSDGATKAVFNCLEKTYDHACPVCSGIGQAINETTDDSTLKLLEGAKANSTRYLVNALILNREGTDPTVPVVLGLPGTVYDQIVKSFFEVDEDTGEEIFVDVTSATEGRNFTIERTGSGVQNTKYFVKVAGKSTPIANASTVEEKIIDLDDFVKQEAEAQTKRALDAIGSISGLAIAAPKVAAAKAAMSAEFDDDEEALRAIESKPAQAPLAAATAKAGTLVVDADELDALASATEVASADADESSELDDILAELN